MNASGPVLRDIHLPSAAWWPPAPGWWIVAALVLLMIGFGAWLLWRRGRQRMRRAALREIDGLATAYENDRDDTQLADGASRLLRRAARAVDAGAASLSGDAWRAFLHQYARDATTRKTLDHLVEARYLAHPAMDAAALLAALRAWCGNALRSGPQHARDHSRTRLGIVATSGTPGEEAAS
ncbi:MAG: DUF4381 domain-containing protein [Rhodanobacteraceae bacterium]